MLLFNSFKLTNNIYIIFCQFADRWRVQHIEENGNYYAKSER